MFNKKIFRKIVGIMAEYIDADTVEMYYPIATVLDFENRSTRRGFVQISDKDDAIHVGVIYDFGLDERMIFDIEFKNVDHMLKVSSLSTLTPDVNVDDLINTIVGAVNIPTISTLEPHWKGGDM